MNSNKDYGCQVAQDLFHWTLQFTMLTSIFSALSSKYVSKMRQFSSFLYTFTVTENECGTPRK